MFVRDIQFSVNQFSKYLEGLNYQAFRNDQLIIDGVLRNLEIIGEASNKIPSTVKIKYPEMPWREMYDLRNRVSHEYFGIDFAIIYKVATQDIPKLKSIES